VKAKTSLKKALSAAEIAGTNAAYAAAGITPTAKGEQLFVLSTQVVLQHVFVNRVLLMRNVFIAGLNSRVAGR